MDNQIKEAVKVNLGKAELEEVSEALRIYRIYLQCSEVMPSKMVCAFHADNNQDGCPFCEHAQTKNKAIDACTFSLMKKMDGLRPVVEGFRGWFYGETHNEESKAIDELLTAIQEYLMGRAKWIA
jgi:hypothetical protein